MGLNWAVAVEPGGAQTVTTGTPGIRGARALPMRIVAAAGALALCVSVAGAVRPATGPSGHSSNVVVEGIPGALGAVEHAVSAVGGVVHETLKIINGVEASIPGSGIALLKSDPAVKSVTADAPVHLFSLPSDYAAATDGYSLYNVTQQTGAQAYWADGYTGQGVGVALVDSGVSPVEGLTSGNVVYGPDLSFDSQNANLADLDSYGHGTAMAGIIAGRDSDATAPYTGDPSDFLGMAPDSHIVSVKVADTYGDTDVSQLIAAIDWVVQNASDPGLNIRVLNLSLGLPVEDPYVIDPLAYAAEQAWDHGIVVVVAAGNTGGGAEAGLSDPGYDPELISVGAANTNGSTDMSGYSVAPFSSVQGSSRMDDTPPSLVAPGMHVATLRDPGSYIDDTIGQAGIVDSRLIRGSGTSEASAVVAGAAALVLSQYPDATPDQVKQILTSSAYSIPGVSSSAQGSGELDLSQAVSTPLTDASQAPTNSNGSGSLQADRGDYSLTNSAGQTMTGNEDIFGAPVNTRQLARAEASGSAWTGGVFNGNTWTGTGMSQLPLLGLVWNGVTWSDQDWTTNSTNTFSNGAWTGTWTGTSFATSALAAHTWSGSTWSGSTWSGSTWSGSTWSGSTWSGSTWSSSTWSSSTWSSSTWSSSTWS